MTPREPDPSLQAEIARLTDMMLQAHLASELSAGVYREVRNRLDRTAPLAHPFQPDDIIRSKSGLLAKVLYVRSVCGRTEHYAVRQKRDGTFGTVSIPLSDPDWDSPTLHARAGESAA